MAHLYLSAAHKSSGKTTLAIGLCAAWRARGLQVQPFKKGPDYIDPLWLGDAAGRPCHNLDFHTMAGDEIDATFATALHGADLGLIEGNKGLYDGVALDGSDSNAALAARLQAPVVLVIDTTGMTRGIAPLLQGYQGFTPAVSLAGVILNRVGGSRHESKLRAAVEHYTDLPVLGTIGNDRSLMIEERHLGLIPSNEAGEATRLIERLARMASEGVDLDRLQALAETAAPALPAPSVGPLPAADLRIGIPRDAAFGFYYPGDFDALRRAGAEPVFFDTLHDPDLPAVDGLFLGGGFPETQIEALEANRSLRRQIRVAIESGLPVHAECGGLDYLCRSLRWGDRCGEMVGAIAADAVMGERPQGRGYARLSPTGDHPWPFGAVAAHEFHYSRLEAIDLSLRFAWRVERGHGIDGTHDGLRYRNVTASYCHLRHLNASPWVDAFVAFVRGHRSRRQT